MSARAQALTISGEHPTPPEDAAEHNAAEHNVAEHDVKITIGSPVPVARPVPAIDPLGAIKAMSEEERIALFT